MFIIKEKRSNSLGILTKEYSALGEKTLGYNITSIFTPALSPAPPREEWKETVEADNFEKLDLETLQI